MKTKLLCLLMAGLMVSCADQKAENNEPEFWLGADLGWITEYEAYGHKFYNHAGEERECTALMKELGLIKIC